MEKKYSIEDLATMAQALWKRYHTYKTWTFSAPMGGGKTTLINALCRLLAVKHKTSSPSFSIINEYLGGDKNKIFHLDLYRLKDEEEAINAGVEDVLVSNEICFVEWAEKFPALLPEKRLAITIELIDKKNRLIRAIPID